LYFHIDFREEAERLIEEVEVEQRDSINEEQFYDSFSDFLNEELYYEDSSC